MKQRNTEKAAMPERKKQDYIAPKAILMPIQLEERVLSCNQPTGSCVYGWQN